MSDSRRIERLAELGQLWGTVQFFHPSLGRSSALWDSALVAAIPHVNAATDSASFAAAVEIMLSALGDPLTRVVGTGRELPSPETEPDPLVHTTPDGILTVTVNERTVGGDFDGFMGRLGAVKQQVAEAPGLLLDLRSDLPGPELDLFLSFVGLERDIIRERIVTPDQRRRMHQGYSPEQGATSGGYFSGFIVESGHTIEPTTPGPARPVVFLVNGSTGVPGIALAMQLAGQAQIVSVGLLANTATVPAHQIAMSYDVTAEIRLSEWVLPGGRRELRADYTLSDGADEQAAFELALSLIRRDDIELPAGPQAISADFSAPSIYPPNEPFPSTEERLLAAFKIWTVVEYFFPYRELMDDDWAEVLRTYLPQFDQAAGALEYHQAVSNMYMHIRDGHGVANSRVLSELRGVALSPLYLRWIEDEVVVTGFHDDEAALGLDVGVGDIVRRVNGQDVTDRMSFVASYLPGSTRHALMDRAAGRLIAGSDGEFVTVDFEDGQGEIRTVEVPVGRRFIQGFTYRDDEVVRLLNDRIGYADLDRLTSPEVPAMFDRFRDTDGIIFDMRGYPNGTAWTIAPYLAEVPRADAAFFQAPMLVGPDGNGRQTLDFMQRLPEAPAPLERYRGRTVMLIDERTQSQAEHTGLFFEAANGTSFIGSHTSGANGDVTNFRVPGGISLTMSGQSVSFPDGRQLQRLGLVPEVEVTPTIAGIRSGRDEVLEAAIEYLHRELPSGR